MTKYLVTVLGEGYCYTYELEASCVAECEVDAALEYPDNTAVYVAVLALAKICEHVHKKVQRATK